MQINEEFVKTRLDVYVSSYMGITRSNAQNLIDEGNVTVNGKVESKNYKLRLGDNVEVYEVEPKTLDILPENIPLNIIYEDSEIIVINKPSGMVVHPAPGNESGTLVNALLYHCGNTLSGINGVIRPGIVHRIDKDTSGLLVVAKNDESHVYLSSLLKDHGIKRTYHAVIIGHMKEQKGTVNAPIARHSVDRKKMAITDKNSKNAVTHYTVLAEYAGYSHVRLRLETGRTHQIRVHMAALGQPVAGAAGYGGSRQPLQSIGLQGQCLHAKKIGFIHPVTNEYLEFDSALPPYFQKVLTHIAK